MTTYELMVLVVPSIDMTAPSAQKDVVSKLVGDKAAVEEVTSLGKKQLAYAIRKQTEATYLVATLKGTIKAAELDTRAKLIDEILRFMLIAKE